MRNTYIESVIRRVVEAFVEQRYVYLYLFSCYLFFIAIHIFLSYKDKAVARSIIIRKGKVKEREAFVNSALKRLKIIQGLISYMKIKS